MKSYSIVAVAVLFAANLLGGNLEVRAAQQPATAVNPGQNEPLRGPASSPASPAAATSGQIDGTSSPANLSFHILAEFTGSLNAKKLKPGDTVRAEVTQDVLSHGKIIIPVESKLVGHVTEVKIRRTDDPESRLGIVFDKVLLRHHREMDFRGILQALSPPAPRRSKVDEPDQMLPPSVMVPGQSSGNGPMGGASSRGSSGSGGPTKTMSVATMPAGAPLYVDGTPGSNAGNSAGANNAKPLSATSESKPMSVGMPFGVFGLKGLSLSAGASAGTPGPVILSRAGDVKLENGTQVLLRVTDISIPQP